VYEVAMSVFVMKSELSYICAFCNLFNGPPGFSREGKGKVVPVF
jgi:hypothetical protein